MIKPSFFLHLLQLIMKLKLLCSASWQATVGPHCISISLLKIPSSHITKPLCTIINDSFSSGVFPDRLKRAKVIPLHKKGATDVLSNYRPISLLSIFSKVIEKLMHKWLFELWEYCNILHPLQFGFHEKHSTLHDLISTTEAIKETTDNGMFGCGVFIDFQKAFDTVNHSIKSLNIMVLEEWV